MGLVWSGLGALGLVAMVAAFAMSALVYFARPNRTPNRLLALLLFFEGTWVGSGHGLIYLTDSVDAARGWQAVDEVALVLLPVLYLLFLGTLDSPLVRWLRRPAARAALAAAGLAAVALVFAFPTRFIAGMEPVPYASWDVVSGPWHVAATRALAVVSGFGFLVAWDAWRRAKPRTLERERSRAYAVAFGTRDAALVLLALVLRPLSSLGGRDLVPTEAYLAGVSLTSLAFAFLVAMGILRTQLFDVDVKLRWTVRQGTLAGAFVAAFFIISEGAAELFTTRAGNNPYLGILGASLLVFFLAPLMRFADRVASTAVPQRWDPTRMTPRERREVYRDMARAAWSDGKLTPKEGRMLQHAATRLGLSLQDQSRIDHEVLR